MGCLLQRNRRPSSSSSVVLLPFFLDFFLAIFLEKSVGVVLALKYSNDKKASSLTLEKIHRYLDKINKPPVMSIESPDGDMIDCIDQWKQPAFDHPRLKNHKLQLAPTEMPREMITKEEEVNGDENISSRKNNEERVEIITSQVWHQNGTWCPEGTVPIRRVTVEDVLRAESLDGFGKKPRTAFGRHAASPDDVKDNGNQEFALVYSNTGKPVYGAIAKINVWNPSIGAENELSASQIWVANGAVDGSDLNTVEAGWMVNPRLFGDSKTRLFAYWTADGYQKTGCYNIMCAGFVQVDKHIVVGSAIGPLSTISGPQKETIIYVWKDPHTGDWWMGYGDKIAVGYWPARLFTSLIDNAKMVEWGGEVVNTKPNRAHTSTQMGSGRFAQEGFEKASYFRDLKVVDSNNHIFPPTDTTIRVDNPNCYNLDLRYKSDNWGAHFFYGGPGFNPGCP